MKALHSSRALSRAARINRFSSSMRSFSWRYASAETPLIEQARPEELRVQADVSRRLDFALKELRLAVPVQFEPLAPQAGLHLPAF